MNTTELIRPPSAPRSEPESPLSRGARGDPPAGDRRRRGRFPPVALAGAWLFVLLVLAGRFALLFTLVVLLVVTALLAVLAAAILATPYLLVRRLRRLRTGHATIGRPALQFASVDSPRAAS